MWWTVGIGAQGRAGELGYYLESSDVEKGEINKLGQQGILEKMFWLGTGSNCWFGRSIIYNI